MHEINEIIHGMHYIIFETHSIPIADTLEEKQKIQLTKTLWMLRKRS